MVNWKKLAKKIPNKVQLSKKGEYEIVWVDSFKQDDVMGETRFDRKQIAIKNKMSAKNTVITYLHEVAHGLSAEHEAQLTENQILALEKGLYYLIKDGNLFKKD
jgi:hypothetical protein